MKNDNYMKIYKITSLYLFFISLNLSIENQIEDGKN